MFEADECFAIFENVKERGIEIVVEGADGDFLAIAEVEAVEFVLDLDVEQFADTGRILISISQDQDLVDLLFLS